MKAKVELSVESLRAVIEAKKPTSMTQLAHGLGYKGSVSSSLTSRFRALVPDIEALLAESAKSAKGGDSKPTAAKSKAAKPIAKAVAKPSAKAGKGGKAGKYARDPRNPFREGSYGTCFDILAKHGQGLPRERLVALLAEATGKDLVHAGYDAQVVLSARPNEDGLNNNDSPRNRSCRPGFWVRRENSHVRLMVD